MDDANNTATVQAMAECMDMVRQELVEAGVIDERVPPMFVSEALLTKLRQLRAAFHVNMVRAYPERTHADIAAEIDRTCWGTTITADDEILALHRQLAAEKLRADLAEARATSKSQECIELRERMAARPAIPSTPEQAIAFIGNQCEVIEDGKPLDRTRFQLTVHDLLSAFDWWFGDAAPSDGAIYEAVSRRADPAGHAAADAEVQALLRRPSPPASPPPELLVVNEDGVELGIERRADGKWQFMPTTPSGDRPRMNVPKTVTVTEKGPWSVSDWGQGRIVIQSNDFTHDVALEISGDFGSVERELAHAEEIARRLNAHPATFVPVSTDLIAAADAVVKSYCSPDWKKPATARLLDRLVTVVSRAKRALRRVTCIGKGGEYVEIGEARGAGTMKNLPGIVVYQDTADGQLYCRSMLDFEKRMQKIEAAE